MVARRRTGTNQPRLASQKPATLEDMAMEASAAVAVAVAGTLVAGGCVRHG